MGISGSKLLHPGVDGVQPDAVDEEEKMKLVGDKTIKKLEWNFEEDFVESLSTCGSEPSPYLPHLVP